MSLAMWVAISLAAAPLNSDTPVVEAAPPSIQPSRDELVARRAELFGDRGDVGRPIVMIAAPVALAAIGIALFAVVWPRPGPPGRCVDCHAFDVFGYFIGGASLVVSGMSLGASFTGLGWLVGRLRNNAAIDTERDAVDRELDQATRPEPLPLQP